MNLTVNQSYNNILTGNKEKYQKQSSIFARFFNLSLNTSFASSVVVTTSLH